MEIGYWGIRVWKEERGSGCGYAKKLSKNVTSLWLIICCWTAAIHPVRDLVGGVARSCRKWAIWKENCSDLPGQEL